jgi:hypothetical protein
MARDEEGDVTRRGRAAGPGGQASDKPKVAVGEVYDRLEVVEQLPERERGARRFKCRCLCERDGRPCGRFIVMTTAQLRSTKFRACKDCSDEYIRARRRAYGQSFFLDNKRR